MFEALRSLRDAVAPDSGSLRGNNSATAPGEQADIEELWHAYKSGDKEVIHQVHCANGGVVLQKREDFVRVHAKMEMEKDTELVQRLANSVLAKSAAISHRVDSLPGMSRNRTDQMNRIEELLRLNRTAIDELEVTNQIARDRKDACHRYIRTRTCNVFNIEEEQY